MKIYVTGDSWVYGDELTNPAEDSWPAVLGRQLNAEVYNDSYRTGSNSHFVYRTIKHLQDDFDLYIIVWTNTAKFTFFKSDNNFDVHFNPQLIHELFGREDYYKIWGRTLYQQWHNRLYAFKLWLQQIIQLQTVLKANNKKYLMINGHENNLKKWLTPWPDFIDATKNLLNFDIMDDDQILLEYNEIQFYIKQINTDCFYKWNEFYLRQLTNQIPMYFLHPNEEGQLYIANMLYNSVQLKNV